MRRFLPVSLFALALWAAAPAGAQTSIVDQPPMDLGTDQTTALNQIGHHLIGKPHYQRWWFDGGVSYPVGNLQDNNVDPGLVLRVNNTFWRSGLFALNGSVAMHWGQDSYFNDQQEEIARNAPIAAPGYNYSGVDIQTRYFTATPVMLGLQVQPNITESVHPFFSLGPGVVFSHFSEVTSAVNNGVGSVSLGDTTGTLIIGPGGEQGISPYAIRTRSRMSVGWEAKAGIGFKVGDDPEHPLWMRVVATGTTYYVHTAPRTLLGFVASFGR
jgi:hypothetical protein